MTTGGRVDGSKSESKELVQRFEWWWKSGDEVWSERAKTWCEANASSSSGLVWRETETERWSGGKGMLGATWACWDSDLVHH